MKVSDLRIGDGIKFNNGEDEFIITPIGCIKLNDEKLNGSVSVYSVNMKNVLTCHQDSVSGELINIYPLN